MSRRRRRKALPQGLFTAEIARLAHDGRGIARIDGKVIFIDGALPGEQVKFEYSFQGKQFDEGRVIEVERASPDRVEPPCRHARICGACSLQHMASAEQIRFKQNTMLEQFEHFAQARVPRLLEPLNSPTVSYRRKARLAVKYVEKKGKVLVGFREKRNSFIADIEQCETLVREVGHRLDLIARLIEGLEARAHIPQIEIAKGDDSTVALVFRHLQPLSEADLDKLKSFCITHDFHLYLQAKGPESIEGITLETGQKDQYSSFERLYYALPEFDVRFAFHPCDFTQVNGDINRLMIERVMDLLAVNKNDVVLDLFCGLGNFSLPLARLASFVIGVEGSEAMVSRAQENAALNSIENVEFYSLNLDQDLAQLKNQPDSWINKDFNKMLIDPPRSGAQEVVESIKLFSGVSTLVYVSCHPATLARDTGILLEQGFVLEAAGVMDMFPHTQHVESVALFTRNIK